MAKGFTHIAPAVRRVSQQVAERLIAQAESKGQTDHAATLRRVWLEHEAKLAESELVQDLMATNEYLRQENAELRGRLKEQDGGRNEREADG